MRKQRVDTEDPETHNTEEKVRTLSLRVRRLRRAPLSTGIVAASGNSDGVCSSYGNANPNCYVLY